MHAQPIALSWSGGKDCLMALQRLQADPAWQVTCLLTTVNRKHDRIAMHGIRRTLLEAQAAALGLPLVTAEMDWPGSNDAYLNAWNTALDQAQNQHPGLRHCGFGDLFLADVKVWREKQMQGHGWQAEFPLWGIDTATLARQFVDGGHQAVLCCVDTQQLDARYCGRAFDHKLLADLPAQVDPCGENGEFHTLVHAGPLLSDDVPVMAGQSVLRDGRFQFQDYTLDGR